MTYKFGQHLEVCRGIYNHHGIFVGDESVIHYSSPPESNGDGVGVREILGADSEVNTIHKAYIDNFILDGHPSVVDYNQDNVYPPLKVVARAQSRLGENGYNLWSNNCEHFSRWCKIADSESIQINFWSSTLKGGASGALLGRFVGPTGALVGGISGAVVGAVRAWLSRKNKLLPVYQEFVEYASGLFLSTKRLHPLGKSFKHSSDFDDDVNLTIPAGKEDKIAVFYYSGSWLFGHSRDWFISERSIVYPNKDIYINFHDVQKIYHSFNSLNIETLDGKKYKLPCKFVNSKSLAKFLRSAVSMTPLYAKDFKISLRSILKEMLKLSLGGLFLTILIGYFFPAATPWLFILTILVVFLSPFPFMDKNEFCKQVAS